MDGRGSVSFLITIRRTFAGKEVKKDGTHRSHVCACADFLASADTI